MTKVTQYYRIEDGILTGTELEPFMAFLLVKYPHRKTKDCYIPPIKIKGKEDNHWHCCQENCKQPEFGGGMDEFTKHLELHTGRLFKKLKPLTGKSKPQIVVTLPANPWEEHDNRGVNPDRRFTISLYMDSVKDSLRKQGIGVADRDTIHTEEKTQ